MGLIDFLEQTKFLNIKLMDIEDFSELALRYTFNLSIIFLLVKYSFLPLQRNRAYIATFFLLNTLIFFLCYLFSNTKLSIGFAFGIFAVFSILRYRTSSVAIHEMTLIFTVVAIGVINALSTKKISYAELIFTNIVILGLSYSLTKLYLYKKENSMALIYENLENIKPDRYYLLISDLKERTGRNITKVNIREIDFKKKSVMMKVFYKAY